MNLIRYLTLLLTMVVCGMMWGQSDFNPTIPAEPGQPPVKLMLRVVPAEAGYAYGAGRYVPGTTASLSTSTNTGFRFDRWADAEGNTLATTSSYHHTKQEGEEVLTAYFNYAPASPSEPQEPSLTQYFRLTLLPTEGGTVGGGGRYLAGGEVKLNAYPATGFKFAGWYADDAPNVCLSTATSFSYTTTAANRTLTARFAYDPASPAEPSDPILQHRLTLIGGEGGYTGFSSKRFLEGTSTTVSAYANTGYKFVGWYTSDGTLYTALSSFSYTMGKTDVVLEARFVFDPSSPSEPARPTTKLFSYYLLNVNGKPGDTVLFPIYLSSLDSVSDMTLRLTFPDAIRPDLTSVEVSEKAAAYAVSAATESDTTFVFTMTGGKLKAGSTMLLRFKAKIPETLPTGLSYPVKINQVSVSLPDGTTSAASTRNGRISCYKLGDTNGDNIVNLLDKMNMITRLLGRTTEVFIEEVSDTNADGGLDFLDAMRLVEMIMEE